MASLAVHPNKIVNGSDGGGGAAPLRLRRLFRAIGRLLPRDEPFRVPPFLLAGCSGWEPDRFREALRDFAPARPDGPAGMRAVL